MKTEWNFDILLKTDFEKERKEIEKAYLSFRDKWKNNSEHLKKPEILKEALDQYENLSKNYSSSETYYYYLRGEKEQNNIEIRANAGKVSEFLKNLGNEIIFFM